MSASSKHPDVAGEFYVGDVQDYGSCWAPDMACVIEGVNI